MNENHLLLEVLAKVQAVEKRIENIEEILMYTPDWVSIAEIAETTGLEPQSVRKQIKSNFEPEVDFKVMRNKMFVTRRVVSLIKRKRK